MSLHYCRLCTKVYSRPGSSCGLVAYTLRILAQRYDFLYGTGLVGAVNGDAVAT